MDPVDRFAEIADLFCSWAEADARAPRDELMLARKLLPRLYSAALDLPEDAALEVDVPLPCGMTYDAAFQRFGALPINMYATCDPLVVPCGEPGVGDVADDLADTYLELSRGLLLYRAGDRVKACRKWAFGFRTHWGAHVAAALSAVHAFATAPPSPDEV